MRNTGASSSEMKTDWRQLFRALAIIAMAALIGCAHRTKETSAFRRKTPVAIKVSKAVSKDIPIEITTIGNEEAPETVRVIPEVSGILKQIYFHGGDYVTKGEKLFAIDRRQFEVAVSQDEAALRRDQAVVDQMRAKLGQDSLAEQYASKEVARYSRLFAAGVISKEQADQYSSTAQIATATVASDKAAVMSAKAQIKADRAMIDEAEDTLNEATIVSPIDGFGGDLGIKAGNVVIANLSRLVTIARISPIYAALPFRNKPSPRSARPGKNFASSRYRKTGAATSKTGRLHSSITPSI